MKKKKTILNSAGVAVAPYTSQAFSSLFFYFRFSISRQPYSPGFVQFFSLPMTKNKTKLDEGDNLMMILCKISSMSGHISQVI